MPVEAALLALKDSTRKQDVERIAESERWIFRREQPETKQGPYAKIWVTPDQQVGVQYVENNFLKVRYMEVRSADLGSAVPRVQAAVNVYTLPELYVEAEAARNDGKLLADVLRKAAVMTPKQFEQRHFEVFAHASMHPSTEVRETVIEASPYIGWRQWEGVLERMAREDKELSRKAQVMLDGMRMHQWAR